MENKRKFILIEDNGNGEIKFSCKGFSIIERIGLLRLQEQKASLEALQSIEKNNPIDEGSKTA